MFPARHDRTTARRWSLPTTVAILLVGGVLTTSLLSACLRRGPDDPPYATGGGSPPLGLPAQLFQGWPADKKPHVALILSGQQHSYLKFCGCSTPQLGGFERRYNLMKMLEAKGWPLVAADLGDVVQVKDAIPEQAYLKCETAMKALEILGFSAMTLGEDDHLPSLDQGVAQYYLQHKNTDPLPRPLVVNLANKVQQFPHPVTAQQSWIGDWHAAGGQNGSPRVAFVGFTGRSVINKIALRNKAIQFMAPTQAQQALQAVLVEINNAKPKADLTVLLFQGSNNEAQQMATAFPTAFDVILCASDEDTPPAQPTIVGKTMIARVGHRGRFIGVVGAFRTGNAARPFELFYQSIPLGEEYETAKGKEAGHPVLKLLDGYAQQVKDQKFLEKTQPREITPAPTLAHLPPQQRPHFVGTDKCVNCHQADAAVWQKSKHSHAYDALSKVASKPALRQYDPECISCHVVGYSYKGGFQTNPKTPSMKHVGCESCHGPGSLHVAAPNNPQYRLAMSPWKGNDPTALLPPPAVLKQGFAAMNPKEAQVYNKVNGDMCQKCHDPDNDPHFKFEKNWLEVIHGKNAANVANPVNQPAGAAKK